MCRGAGEGVDITSLFACLLVVVVVVVVVVVFFFFFLLELKYLP